MGEIYFAIPYAYIGCNLSPVDGKTANCAGLAASGTMLDRDGNTVNDYVTSARNFCASNYLRLPSDSEIEELMTNCANNSSICASGYYWTNEGHYMRTNINSPGPIIPNAAVAHVGVLCVE